MKKREERFEVPPPGLYIRDEMAARGWTAADVAARMNGLTEHDRGVDELAVDLLTHVFDPNVRLGTMTPGLADAFGVPSAFLLNLERAWVDAGCPCPEDSGQDDA
jgi:hypothetical protein